MDRELTLEDIKSAKSITVRNFVGNQMEFTNIGENCFGKVKFIRTVTLSSGEMKTEHAAEKIFEKYLKHDIDIVSIK
jgi:hypothetical protein